MDLNVLLLYNKCIKCSSLLLQGGIFPAALMLALDQSVIVLSLEWNIAKLLTDRKKK